MSGGKKELPARTAAINNLVAFLRRLGTRVKAARESSDYSRAKQRLPSSAQAGGARRSLCSCERAEKGTENFISPEDATAPHPRVHRGKPRSRCVRGPTWTIGRR
jgi:hypothetical protein